MAEKDRWPTGIRLARFAGVVSAVLAGISVVLAAGSAFLVAPATNLLLRISLGLWVICLIAILARITLSQTQDSLPRSARSIRRVNHYIALAIVVLILVVLGLLLALTGMTFL